MHAPAVAIAWEIARKNRWVFRLVLAAPVACALLYGLGAGLLRASAFLRGLSLLPMILSLTWIFVTINYTETEARSGWTGGYPSRLFTLPVRTSLLVACPILFGVATVTLLYVAWARLVFPLVGFTLPVVRPVLFLAVGMVCYQAILWGLAGFRLARLLVLGLLATGLFGTALIAGLPEFARTCPWPVDGVLAAGLIPLALAAYGGALLAVENQRHGGGRARGWWRKGLYALVDALPRRHRPFALPRQALGWYEWRRSGWVLPACVALILVVIDVPVLWIGGKYPELTLYTLCWVIVLPMLLAAAVGQGFGRADFWSREMTVPTFLAVRPVRSGDLVAAKLRAAAFSSLAAWALVLAVAPLVPLLGCDTSLVEKFGRALAQQYHPVVLAALVSLALLAVLILTWRLLVGSLHIGLTGRLAIFLGSLGVSAAGVLGFVVVFTWLLTRPDPAQTLADLAPWGKRLFEHVPEIAWVLYLAFLLKLWGAAWAWHTACRRGLVSRRAAWAYLAIWSLTTACLLAGTALLFAPAAGASLVLPFNILLRAGWIEGLLLLSCLFVVPLARLGVAPLALAWNRHR